MTHRGDARVNTLGDYHCSSSLCIEIKHIAIRTSVEMYTTFIIYLTGMHVCICVYVYMSAACACLKAALDGQLKFNCTC